jgi:NADH-quinone oxidoreductase subunit L
LKNGFMPGTPFFRGSLPDAIDAIEVHFVPLIVKISPTVFSMLGIAYCLYIYQDPLVYPYIFKVQYRNWFILLNKKFFFDSIYNFINQKFVKFTFQFSYREIDRGILEYFGPTGTFNISNKLAYRLRELYTGYIFHFVFIFVTTIITFAIIYFMAV